MKYDLQVKFLDAEDKVLKDPKGAEFTLKLALLQAFAAGVDDNGQPVQGIKKMDYYDLYTKVKKSNGSVEFSAAEAAQALGAIKGAYGPIVAGQARDFLDQRKE